MAKIEQKSLVRELLRRHGTTFAEELRITLADRPQPLFQLLVFSIMASAPIRTTNAARGARTLFDKGWKSPDDFVRTTWKQKVTVLNRGGYARFDEKTSGILFDTATILLDRWNGDLRVLRTEARHDPARERALLKSFKGMGDVAVDILFRDAQAVWRELYPFADRRALQAARRLGLPADAEELARLAQGRRFTHLIAALIRTGLENDYDEIRLRAADRTRHGVPPRDRAGMTIVMSQGLERHAHSLGRADQRLAG